MFGANAFGWPYFAQGYATVTLPAAPREPTGGTFVFSRRRATRNLQLRPRHANVCVTAFAPTLTLTTGVPLANVDIDDHTSAPTFTLRLNPECALGSPTQKLGELPASRRSDINMILLLDR